MGWGFIDPARLLRKTWESAADLALELYSMTSEQTPAKVDRPVELNKPQGRPALTISPASGRPDSRQEVRLAASESGRPTSQQGVRRQAQEQQKARGVMPTPLSTYYVAEEAIDSAKSLARPVVQEAERRASETVFAAPIKWLAGKAVDAALSGLRPAPDEPAPAVQPQMAGLPDPADTVPMMQPAQQSADGQSVSQPALAALARQDPPRKPEFRASRYDLPAVTPQEVAHPDPVADISGPVVFRGPEPVQFATPPQVFDQRSGRYVPIPQPPMLGASWTPWLTINSKICWCDSTGVSAATLRQPPSTSELGTGVVRMYEVDQNTPTLVEISDGGGEGGEAEVRVYSMYAMPFKSTFVMATMLGDNWFIFPIGSAVVAETRSGGIPASNSATCDIYSTIGGGTIPAGEAVVYSDMEKTVGSAGGVRLVATIDTSGQLRVVAEACP